MTERVGNCAGCGRTPAQTERLLGRGLASDLVICDRCVVECADLIASSPTRIPGAARSCTFCAKTEDQVAVMIGIGAHMICDECVDFFRAANKP